MAQIIKHRRGSLEGLSAVTSSVQKGELLIATGSSNLTTVNGASLVFAAAADGQIQAVNRFLQGNSAPSTFSNASYNGLVNGVPYYDSGSGTLYLLGSDANTAINLVGNIQPFSQSVATSINALSASIGSGTIGQSVTALNTFSASQLTQNSTLATYTASVDTRLTQIGVVSGSLISSASAASVSITNLNASSASQQVSIDNLNSFSASANTRFTEIGVVSGSLIASASAAKTTNDAQGVSITNLNTFSASVNTSISNINTTTASLNTSVSNINTTTASLNASIAALNSYTSSNTSTNALNAFTASANERFATIASVTASYDGRFTTLATVTGSLSTSASNAVVAITNLNAATGSYSKLAGGNVFTGQQVISGSLYITNDLIVQGSSSIQNITSSNLTLGSAFVTLNTATPISRFAGLQIIDSGSSGGSGSFLYDALQDEFVFVHRGNGLNVTSSHFLLGPETYDDLGNETYLTNNRLPKGTGKEHLNDSQITDDGTTVSIPGNLTITGSIIAPQLNAIGTITGSLILSASADRVSISNINTLTSSALVRFTNLETTSASVNTSIAALNSYTSSNTSTTALNAFTASADGRFTTLANVTASLNASTASQQISIDALNTFSASANTRFTEIGVVSGSLISSASAAAIANANQNTFTASANVSITNLNTFSSSALTRLSALEVETANLETTTASLNISVANLNLSSASQQVSIDALNAYTASNTSTNALNAFTASANTRFTEIGVVSGSLISSASAAKTTNDAQDVSITNLNSATASLLTSVANLNSFSGSQLGKDTNLAIITGSLISSASAAAVSISNINTFTQSAASRLTTLEGTGTIQGLGTGNNVTFAKVTTSGDVVVGGDLVVQGNTVSLNTATLIVEDKLITLASGSTSSATADGAGFEVAGANANFVYQHSTTAFTSSVALIAPAVTASVNLGTGAGNSKRIAFRNTNGNLDLVPTASVSGDLLQWNGTDFVMSNVIDGGSF